MCIVSFKERVKLSRPSAFGEYEPYHFVNSKEEFEKAVLNMCTRR